MKRIVTRTLRTLPAQLETDSRKFFVLTGNGPFPRRRQQHRRSHGRRSRVAIPSGSCILWLRVSRTGC